MKIFVLDDEKVRVRKFEEVFKSSTCEVISSSHCYDAIFKIIEHKPDVIFLDHDLADERDIDTGMVVCHFLADYCDREYYWPTIVIHSMNEPCSTIMSSVLESRDIIPTCISYCCIDWMKLRNEYIS
jgi:two-component SAPR family response regulator